MDTRIEARIAALEAEISSLKQAVTETDDGPVTSDRRGMVKLLAATAVGAVTGAAMLGAQPAAAADGDNVKIAQINEGTTATLLTASGDSALILQGNGGYGVETDGVTANALFNATGESPLGSTALAGALFVDGAGDWWAAVTGDAPSAWVKLAGPNTAGQLHVLTAPVRVYDSRPGEAPTAVGPKAQTEINVPRTIDTTVNASGVPLGANAVLITLTIAGPTSAGFATTWPGGAIPGTSTINFSPGQNIATTTTVGCGPSGTIQVLSNSVTDFLVDVIGYYQ